MMTSNDSDVEAAVRWRELNAAARARGCRCGRPATEVRYLPATVGGVPAETWTCAEHVDVEAWYCHDGVCIPANAAWGQARYEAGLVEGRALAAEEAKHV